MIAQRRKLTNQLVLISEVGFDSGIWTGSFYEKTGFLTTPAITAEPRWYYNLKKRERKSNRIDANNYSYV